MLLEETNYTRKDEMIMSEEIKTTETQEEFAEEIFEEELSPEALEELSNNKGDED
jgi:hypothetical protein